jgi:hypothetical protein
VVAGKGLSWMGTYLKKSVTALFTTTLKGWWGHG